MRAHELLAEKPVESSWITDLSYNRTKRIITITLSNHKKFLVPGISRTVFNQWATSPSKGKFFHERIKGAHPVNRIS